jgi:vitamin B12 transporter
MSWQRGGRWAAAALVAGAIVSVAGVTRAGEAAPAGEPTAGEEPIRTEPVVVTATRIEQPVSQVGSSVTVIQGEDLRRRGVEFLPDALREVPGLTVAQNGARGKQASIFLRGANSDQTLVLVDGVRINDPVGGAVDLGFLGTDNIERIEVVRGPQSTLYGSDAMGGVVNIITRRGDSGLTGSAEALAGNYDTYRLGAAARGGTDAFGASVEASRLDTDNRYENDDFAATALSARLDGRAGDRLSLTFSVRRTDSETGVRGSAFFPPPELADRQESDLLSSALSAELRTTSAWTQRLTLGWTGLDQRFRSPTSSSDRKSIVRSIEWVHTVRPAEPLTLLAGAEYRVEDGDFQNSTGTDIAASLYTRALFARAELTPVRDRLVLEAGARLDDATRVDEEVSPRVAGALLVPESGTRVHASWGKAIKAPTLLDLYFPGLDVPGLGIVFTGNPDLEPERSRGWDAGVTQQLLGRRVEADVTFFRNDFRDLIVNAQTLPFESVNVGRARTYGVESSLLVRPTGRLDLAATYTYLEARDEDTETQLLRRPRNQGSTTVTVRPLAAASLSLTGLYIGPRRDFLATNTGYIGGYFRLDAAATYRLPLRGRIGAELLARVENLLDREYEDVAGFPALRANVLAGARVTF